MSLRGRPPLEEDRRKTQEACLIDARVLGAMRDRTEAQRAADRAQRQRAPNGALALVIAGRSYHRNRIYV